MVFEFSCVVSLTDGVNHLLYENWRASHTTGQGCHVPSRITIKEARCLAAPRTKMDLQELERIKADARAMQILLEIPPINDSCPRLQAARVNCERIVECCERLSKKIKTEGTPSAPEDDGSSEKARLVEQSRRAGESIIPFGKHKGKAIKAVPHSYLCWLLGVRRAGREFENLPMDKHGWIISNHADVIAQVKAFLTWRCWACGSTDTRFQFSRLCPECWHDSGAE